ncbi:MAG: hypothetical protein ACRDQY_04705 [Pseudonocardiaceae bacterium]
MADSLPAMNPELIEVVAGVLAEHGPMTEDQLIAALAGRGVDLGDTLDRTLGRALDDGDRGGAARGLALLRRAGTPERSPTGRHDADLRRHRTGRPA